MTPAALAFPVLAGVASVAAGFWIRRRAESVILPIFAVMGLEAISRSSAALPLARALTPVVSGLGTAGIALLILLSLRPEAGSRPRMAAAAGLTLAVHGAYLALALGAR